jgi:molybdopterin-guanine dinucleotide biosynthesis protein A
LTGGASTRFGTPKATFVVDGMRLADRVADTLGTVAEPVLEVGPGYTTLVAVRESPAGSGPLAAVAAGAAGIRDRTDAEIPILVVAVDLPYVDRRLLALLRDHAAPGAVVPVLDGRAQPLCARYPADVHVVARALVDGGRRSMQALLDALDVTMVEESTWTAVASRRALADVDTREDARRIGIEAPG